MSDVPGELRCMLIPLRGMRLLLPSATVAEVIGYRAPDPPDNAPPWLQGTVSWRQREIPVIDFESVLGREHGPGGIRQRIAICYAAGESTRWPLLGLVTQGIPRLLRLSAASIEGGKWGGEDGQSPIRLRLRVVDETFVIPDLAYLQSALPALRDR